MHLRHFSWKQRAGLELASVFQNTHFDTIPRVSFNRLAKRPHPNFVFGRLYFVYFSKYFADTVTIKC